MQANLVWNWNMTQDSNWSSSASQVETSKVELECSVKCSQLTSCASFITSGGQCFTGTVIPSDTDFTASDTVTISHFTRSDL